jgi:phenylalanyl-tRNA synthetase beta chain
MKLSLNWLQRYIHHGLTPDELQHRLTMAGMEVEAVEKIGDDTVFEIEVTPNRPDCLNILGLAREVSAVTDKELLPPPVSEFEDIGAVDITIEDPSGCGRYIGTLIEGAHVQAMPPEYSRLLQAVGINRAMPACERRCRGPADDPLT